TVYNAGTVGAMIDSIVLTSTSNEFSLVTPAMPAPLQAGGQVPFKVDYRPTALGQDANEVQITVHDTRYQIIVPLRGAGDPNPRATEQFTQQAARKVDVLFVIDDSCSMFDEQQSLVMNFREFIMQANLRSVDFQIGVTRTTLFPVPGQLVGPVLT